jgi:hypothetical protein
MALQRSMTLIFGSMDPESWKPNTPNYLQVLAQYQFFGVSESAVT